MKKILLIFMMSLLALTMISCGSADDKSEKKSKDKTDNKEQTEETVEDTVTNHKLYLDFSVALPGDCDGKVISVEIDAQDPIVIECDEYFTYLSELEEGEHQVSFFIDDDLDVESVQNINLIEDTSLICSVGYSEGMLIISDVSTSNSIADSEIVYEDLSGVAVEEALAKLSEKHFVNVNYVSNDGTVVMDIADWEVESQNVSSGDVLDITAPIELVCDKVYHQFYIDLTFDSNIVMAKYGLDMYVDDEKICNIGHGKACTQLMRLKEGSHTVTFYKETDNSVKASKIVNLDGDATIKARLHTNDKDIEINDYQHLDTIEGASIEMCNVKGMFLDDALKTLHDAGFANVTTQSDGSIWASENWTVTEQSVAAGTETDKNTAIVLTCVKNTDYLTDTYLAKYVNEAEATAAQNNNQLNYVNYLDGTDMNSKVASMTTDEKKLWYIRQCLVSDGKIKLRIAYNGKVEMINVVGQTASKAKANLNGAEFSAVIIKSDNGSTIYNYDEWKITEQSVSAGTMHPASVDVTLTATKIQTASTTSNSSSSSSSSSSGSHSSSSSSGSYSSHSSTGSSSSASSDDYEIEIDFAMYKHGTNYDSYYIFDIESLTAVYFITNDTSGIISTITVTKDNHMILTYNNEWKEELYEKGDKVVVKAADGYEDEYTPIDVNVALIAFATYVDKTITAY